MSSSSIEKAILTTTKEIVVNGSTYEVRPLPPENSIEILRLTVLHGLVKAPFDINRANIEGLSIEVLDKISTEIGVLTQQLAESLLERVQDPKEGGSTDEFS